MHEKNFPGKFNRVFLIEDDDISAYLTQMLLEELDLFHSFQHAKNGAEAIRMLLGIDFPKKSDTLHNVILLDLKMPEMDGAEFLEEFFRNTDLANFWKIYVLTSSTSYADIQSVIKHPIKGYLIKPLSKEKLDNLISEYS
jgi:CheY-like chemotaxis protein